MKKRIAFAAVLALGFTVEAALAAQGFVVTKDTVLYKNDSADTKADQIVIKLAPGQAFFPAQENVAGHRIVISTNCISFHSAAQEFGRMDPTRYFVIGDLSKSGKGWEKGWIEISAGELFDYEVTLHSVFCPNNSSAAVLDGESFLKSASRKLEEAAYRDFKPPVIEHNRTFDSEVQVVWAALIEVLSDRQVRFDVVEKSSGLITTASVPDPLKDTMVCPSAYDQGHRMKFNILVKDAGDGRTLVKVNSSFVANDNETPIHCFSNGTIEKWVLDGVSGALNQAPVANK